MARLEGKPGGSLVTKDEFFKELKGFHNRLAGVEITVDKHDEIFADHKEKMDHILAKMDSVFKDLADFKQKMEKMDSFYMEELHNTEENLKNFRIFMNRADQMLETMPNRDEMEEIEEKFKNIDEILKQKRLNDMDFREETRKTFANLEYELGGIHEELEKLGEDKEPEYSSSEGSESDRE